VTIPASASRIDVSGKYVLPGFFDVHIHLMYPPTEAPQSDSLSTLRALHFMQRYLEAGVTAVRDVGATIEPMQALLAAQQAGYIDSIRLYPVGQLITTTGGHGTSWSYFATGPYGFREAVRTMYAAGFRHIKLSPMYTEEEVRAAVDEARTLGMEVTSHGGGGSDTVPPSMTRRAVEAGVDCIEHLNPMPDDVLDLIAERGVHLVPTLAIYRILYQLELPTLMDLIEQRGWSMSVHEELFRKAHRRGILLGVGTDAVGTILDEKYPGLYFDEIKYFVELGMTPLEAITAASRNGAIIVGEDEDLGTLEVGKLADLQVVGGNPLESLDALGEPEMVMIGGRIKYRR
jgi:imidazolonepropionase-like amidohydrolase